MLHDTMKQKRQSWPQVKHGFLCGMETEFKQVLVRKSIGYQARRAYRLRWLAQACRGRKADGYAAYLTNGQRVLSWLARRWAGAAQERKVDKFGFFERHAFSKLDRYTRWQVVRAVRPGGERSRRGIGTRWTKDDAERACTRCALRPTIPKLRATRLLTASLGRIGHPEQFQKRVAKEEASVRGSLPWMSVRRALVQAQANECISLWSPRRAADEYVIELESHGEAQRP